MKKTFLGRPVIPGEIKGETLVSRQGFNILASFRLRNHEPGTPITCTDQNNPGIYQKAMVNKILCLPQAIGSTTGGLILATAAAMNQAPSALLFSKKIDSLSASGVVLSDVWLNKKIITVDQLGDDFLETLKDDQTVEVLEDGTVILH